ncbi:hypothetical protein [Mycoplasmopsis glycophila]|uniref:Uncharacterized protein n=1 Tax=Mycoplasmopsis glycophila TaxID=171285 RepID=A0A449AUY3_9BACT|nr:hypothetical protein [Mycoplasmopsis glycophila]VEU70334.1 Uncharacterised protein [Mycoplasmopsis glycophila]
MILNKKEFKELIDKFKETNTINKLTNQILNNNKEIAVFESLSFINVANEYLGRAIENLKDKQVYTFEEIMFLANQNLKEIAENNVNRYEDDLRNELSKKFEYFIENENDYFNTFGWKNKNNININDMLTKAETFVLYKFLINFHSKLETKLKKELDKESYNEMTF